MNVSFNSTAANFNGTPLPSLMEAPASVLTVVFLSIFFIIVSLVGLAGNILVLVIVITRKKMKNSITNLFIANVAVADFLLLCTGVPEMIQFVLNRGWTFGETACKVNRFVTVTALYVSIMSLVLVCIERYLATVHPVRAHILCSRRLTSSYLGVTWPMGALCGLPTAFFNHVTEAEQGRHIQLCLLRLPGDNNTSKSNWFIFKFTESALFFFIPMIVQIFMYSVIIKQLFYVMRVMKQRGNGRMSMQGTSNSREHENQSSRKGVIKMLVACVVVYFISYAPAQVPVFYDAFAEKPFKSNWNFLALVMMLAYVNSAANPILYCIFSHQFRRSFTVTLRKCFSKEHCCKCKCKRNSNYYYSSSTPHINGMRMQTLAFHL